MMRLTLSELRPAAILCCQFMVTNSGGECYIFYHNSGSIHFIVEATGDAKGAADVTYWVKHEEIPFITGIRIHDLDLHNLKRLYPVMKTSEFSR